MRLYVWEGDGVLTDYTSGMIVALASDLESALAAIRAKCNYCMACFPNDKPAQVIDLGPSDAKPEAWISWGRG